MALTERVRGRQLRAQTETANLTGTADKRLSQNQAIKGLERKPIGPLFVGEPALGYDPSIIHAETCSCPKCPTRTMNPDVGTEL